MEFWTNSLIAMHSFDGEDIRKWNGASSQELNRGYKFFIEEQPIWRKFQPNKMAMHVFMQSSVLQKLNF